jgi:hypothetical protein
MSVFFDKMPTPQELRAKVAEPVAPRPVPNYRIVSALIFRKLEWQLRESSLPITIEETAERLLPHVGQFLQEAADAGWVVSCIYERKTKQFKLFFDAPEEEASGNSEIKFGNE